MSQSPSAEPSGLSTLTFLEGTSLAGKLEQYSCGYASADGSRVSAYWPHIAFFCPACGEIWARAIYTHHFAYQPVPQAAWVVETRRCPQHGDGYLLIGKESQLEYATLSLLKREVLLLALNNPSWS